MPAALEILIRLVPVWLKLLANVVGTGTMCEEYSEDGGIINRFYSFRYHVIKMCNTTDARSKVVPVVHSVYEVLDVDNTK